MSRVVLFLAGVICYVVFLATFLYAIGFVGGVVVPKALDDGAAGPLGQALPVNILLLGLFGIQHSVMSRPFFKIWWTRFVPKPIERSIYVLATCAVLSLLFWQWRPMPTLIWQIDTAAAEIALWVLFCLGWVLVLYSNFLIYHFDLFGLRQVYLHLRGRGYTRPAFCTPPLYRLIRNPLMLGFIIAFWSTPVMTAGHLLFAVGTTAYILVGITLEEHDLLQALGEDYRRFRAATPMILPLPRERRTGDPVRQGESS